VASEPTRNTGRDRTTQFITLLTSHQPKLYAYISTLVFGDAVTADLLQETNLHLWAQVDQFDFDRPFLAWAFGFARQRVLAYRKTCGRSRLVFDDETVELVSDKFIESANQVDERLAALQKCLKRLPSEQADLIHQRYLAKTSVQLIAERLSESAHNISSRLHRIRKILAKCIEHTMATEDR
jgi:RNA polymerase sigma-70 factor, ECF subfamily